MQRSRIVVFSSLLLLLTAAAAAPTAFTVAQSGNEAVETRRAQLRGELRQLEREINKQQELLEVKQRERVSLERDLAILNAKIEKARLAIRARTIVIEQLNQDIATKERTIGGLNDKLAREKESLAQLFRKTNKIDDFTLVEIILSNERLSEFFEDVDSFSAIKEGLTTSFREIAHTKQNTQEEKEALQGVRAEELELRTIQELQKEKIEQQEAQKQEIFDITKGVEERYQQLIREKQKTAAEIRSELFSLRGSAAIPFGDALTLAQGASRETGVRPALILGVIAEESNLGENVGTGNWRTDMHPDRDQPVFQQIMQRLGLNPDSMPVSAKPWYGWGGAMGPAQFIPSTWVLYEDRIAEKTGNNPPNPWDPEDAFMAAAILLMDNGADRGTYGAERLAALRYFAGWVNAENPSYAFYGDEVMELTAKYQQQINILVQS